MNHDRHAEIDISDHLAIPNGGKVSEIVGAEQPLFLRRNGDDKNAARGRPAFHESAGDFEHHGDARGVVHGAVVDAVLALGRQAFVDADVIEMGAEHDIFVFQLRIGAGD